MAIMNLPEGLFLSNVSITHDIPNFKTESMNLKQKTKSRGLHRLEGKLDITVGGTIKNQKAYTGFLMRVQGSYNEFELDLPRHFKSDDISNNPIVSVAANIGNNILSLGFFTGEIYAGSCFTVPNDTKTYFVKDDVLGGNNVEIYPALRTNVLAGGTINFMTPVITARFKADSQSVEFTNNGMIVESSIQWLEAL